jgi:hypothetical protein
MSVCHGGCDLRIGSNPIDVQRIFEKGTIEHRRLDTSTDATQGDHGFEDVDGPGALGSEQQLCLPYLSASGFVQHAGTFIEQILRIRDAETEDSLLYEKRVSDANGVPSVLHQIPCRRSVAATSSAVASRFTVFKVGSTSPRSIRAYWLCVMPARSPTAS